MQIRLNDVPVGVIELPQGHGEYYVRRRERERERDAEGEGEKEKGEQATDPILQAEIRQLSARQAKLQDMIHKIATGANE